MAVVARPVAFVREGVVLEARDVEAVRLALCLVVSVTREFDVRAECKHDQEDGGYARGEGLDERLAELREAQSQHRARQDERDEHFPIHKTSTQVVFVFVVGENTMEVKLVQPLNALSPKFIKEPGDVYHGSGHFRIRVLITVEHDTTRTFCPVEHIKLLTGTHGTAQVFGRNFHHPLIASANRFIPFKNFGRVVFGDQIG